MMIGRTIHDENVIRKLKSIPLYDDAINYIYDVKDTISDYTYWDILISLIGNTTADALHRNYHKEFELLNTSRASKPKWLMTKDNLTEYKNLPYKFKAYGIVTEEVKVPFCYYIRFEDALKDADIVRSLHIKEYEIKKQDVIAVVSNRRVLCCSEQAFIREHAIMPGAHISIAPYKSGEKGKVCMPLKKNVPQGKQGWIATKCPNCGQECWQSPLVRSTIIGEEIEAVCTECAIANN